MKIKKGFGGGKVLEFKFKWCYFQVGWPVWTVSWASWRFAIGYLIKFALTK